MTTNKATLGPWEKSISISAEGRKMWDICANGGGDMIADLAGCDNAEANAAFIVKAVNNHDALVAALEKIERGLPSNEGLGGHADLIMLGKIARQSLANAREG